MNKLEQLLNESGLTRDAFAARAGISQRSLYYYMNGQRDIAKAGDPTIRAMADVLGVHPSELFGREDIAGTRDHHEYEKVFIGESDAAALTLTGYVSGVGVTAQILKFGEDGAYSAYIVDADANIPDHYRLVAVFNAWVRIYDDTGMAAKITAPTIEVFRAGDRGCIIRLPDGGTAE